MIKNLYEIVGKKMFDAVEYDYETQKDTTCATESQIGYLMGLIKNHKFNDGKFIKKVAEVGVSSGMTSMYMLKAGKNRQDFLLYGIEKATGEYYGHCVYEGCDEKEISMWKFCPGTTTYDVKDILKDDTLDMIFIDGMHAHPGALIDFLLLYPFMRKDGIVILHDVETYSVPSELGACYFYTAWRGDKRLNYYVDNDGKLSGKEYMGILDLCRDKEDILNDLIEIARQPITGASFNYSSNEDPLGINVEDIDITLRMSLMEYYPQDFVSEIINILLDNLKDYKSKWIYYKHLNRMLDRTECHDVTQLAECDFSDVDKIAIWGAGYLGRLLVTSLRRKGELSKVVAVVDSDFDKEMLCIPLSKPEKLQKVEFQNLVIAVKSREIFSEIRKQAMEIGVPSDKIIWIYERL